MLALLPALAPSALAIEIEAPKSVRVGEAFRVKARLVNRSERPVVIVRPIVPNAPLGMGCGGGLFRDGAQVKTAAFGLQIAQWVVPFRYGPGSFQTLKPGASVPIEDVEYRQVWAREPPSLKSEIVTAPRKDLPPGEYTLRFSYAFRPKPKDLPRAERRGSLTDEGRPLYKAAWAGEAKAEATVVVSDA